MTQQHNAATWRISQVALNVDDLEAAIAFYRDTLGIPLIAAGSSPSRRDAGVVIGGGSIPSGGHG